jgi:predicted dehydrogenase
VRGIPGWGVFIDKSKQGGGPLIDIGVHILDLTLWLMGHPRPTFASGVTYQKFGTRPDVVGFMGQWDYKNFTVEDFASALIRFENGATIVLESSFVANLKEEQHGTTLLGTAGGAQTSPLTITQERHGSVFSFEPRIPNKDRNSYHAEIKDFVACVGKGGSDPLATGRARPDRRPDHGRIYRSSDEGREVTVGT